MHVEKTAVCGAPARSYGGVCLELVTVWSGSQYEDLFGALFRGSHFLITADSGLMSLEGISTICFVVVGNYIFSSIVSWLSSNFSKWARVEGLVDS
jgi:hypothetical protein